MRSADKVKAELGEQTVLRVYQFNDPNANLLDSQKREGLDRKREELNRLVGNRGRFFQSDSFDKLEEQIKMDLPQSEVVVLNAAKEVLKRGSFGKDIELELKEKDLPLRVMVQAKVSDISSKSEAPKSKEQILQLVGNEQLVLNLVRKALG